MTGTIDWPPYTDEPDRTRNVLPSSRKLAGMTGYSASKMAVFGRGNPNFPYRRGRDEKIYPSRSFTPSEREHIALLVHGLSHDGQSVRQIQNRLRDLGIRRSVGAISDYLHSWPCRCNADLHT